MVIVALLFPQVLLELIELIVSAPGSVILKEVVAVQPLLSVTNTVPGPAGKLLYDPFDWFTVPFKLKLNGPVPLVIKTVAVASLD